MKNLTTKLMIAAAVMAVGASAASAQSMKTDVPFAFRTATGTLAAGAYEVSMDNSKRIVLIRRVDGTKSVLLLPTTSLTAGTKTGAKLVFSCGVSHCTLVQIWSGPQSAAYEFHRPKPDRDEEASLVAIRLHRDAD